MIDIVTILNDEFLKKKSKNNRYSLRAFAKYLDIDPSLLSRILNKKIPISNKILNKVQRKIQLDTKTFLEVQNSLIKERLDPKNKWGLDTFFEEEEFYKFKFIQEWHYLAIIELIQIEGFKLDAVWIAKELGITKSKALDAITNLKKLKIIKLAKNKKWYSTIGYQALLEKNLFALAMKNRQREILHKAAEDVVDLEAHEFEQCSFSMAIDSSLIVEAKKRMHTFKKKLAKDLSKKSKKKDKVYEFSISFFPLSNKKRSE
jgi:uncharacterized protein (TIGR02147 family)